MQSDWRVHCMMPMLVKNCGVRWSGAWTIEALQSPEKPYVVEYLDLLLQGQYSQAMQTHWHIKSAYQALFELMAPALPRGVHPFTPLKYYQWSVGGNGGLLRAPVNPVELEFPLTAADRAKITSVYRAIGIEPS